MKTPFSWLAFEKTVTIDRLVSENEVGTRPAVQS
jgi:hypothetical protein